MKSRAKYKSRALNEIVKSNLNIAGLSVSKQEDGKETGAWNRDSLLPSVSRISRSHDSGINNSIDEEMDMTLCGTVILHTTVEGKTQATRSAKERERNPDRLSLDKRGLGILPMFVGEEKLRLLSLQHNLLTKLDKRSLQCLPYLVFLDIYANQLQDITALDTLTNLRVLLLGKNRIKEIDGLYNLTRLEVLDLHGNRITQINGLKSLHELKVLNLAGNEIKQVGKSDLIGLTSLQELNLRRNKITRVIGFDCTPQLSKLFLSNNEIKNIDEIYNLTKLSQLKEITLDGNNIADNEECFLLLTSYLPSLQLYGHKRITDEIRKTSNDWLLRKQMRHNSITSSTRIVDRNKIRPNRLRFKRLSYAKQKTVSGESCGTSDKSNEFKLPPIFTPVDDCSVVIRDERNASLDSNKSSNSIKCDLEDELDRDVDNELIKENAIEENVNEKITNVNNIIMIKQNVKITKNYKRNNKPTLGKIREQGGDYLVEIAGRYLNVFGKNSARYIDKGWNEEKASDVTTVRFNNVPFDSLLSIFNKIRTRFPKAEHFIFNKNNINYLGQLNALADIQGLTSLQIESDCNMITKKQWTNYAVFRLHHWALTSVNQIKVTQNHIEEATEEYMGLNEIVLWSLPESLLTPLLCKLKLEVSDDASAKQWLYNADAQLRNVICKEALQWRHAAALSQNEIAKREEGRSSLNKMIENTCRISKKLWYLEKHWEDILKSLVMDALSDYSEMESYKKSCINRLKPP